MSGEPVAHRRARKFPEAAPRQGGGASVGFSSPVGKAKPFRSSGGRAARTSVFHSLAWRRKLKTLKQVLEARVIAKTVESGIRVEVDHKL